MLKRVKKHGFEFYEAPQNANGIGLSEPGYRAVALAEFLGLAVERVAELSKGEDQSAKPADLRGWPVSPSIATKTLERRENVTAREGKYDPGIWGELVYLSDEEPEEGAKLNAKTAGVPAKGPRARTLPRPRKADAGVEEIQRKVMELFQVTEKQFFTSRKRNGRAVAGRIASMALCRAHTRLTLEEIGRTHGRDHAAVARATWRCVEMRALDRRFNRFVTIIDEFLSHKETTAQVMSHARERTTEVPEEINRR